MKIGIDARFVGPEGTGLGKYTEKLILNLAKIDKKNEYCIFLRSKNWNFLKLPKNFKKVLADVRWYSFEEQLKLAGVFSGEKLDLVHVPHFNMPVLYRGKFVVTIHDLIHHQFSEQSTSTKNFLMFKIKRGAYKIIIYSAAKRAAKIIVPSNFVKKQVINAFKIDPGKVAITYEAAEQEYFNQTQKPKFKTQNLLKKLKIKKPYIIYVGNAYPHKNLEKLLDAFKILITHSPREAWAKRGHSLAPRSLGEAGSLITHLVIVCPRDIFFERLRGEIAKRDLKSRVILSGYLEAKELKILFGHAAAYVFPSLSEGFGIPGLNAMAAKIPVVCSNIPTLKEIYEDAAVYFDPKNANDIAMKIEKVLDDTKTRTDLVEKGKQLVKKYSWQKMAQETLRVYESAQ